VEKGCFFIDIIFIINYATNFIFISSGASFASELMKMKLGVCVAEQKQ
jgi:hypothetical protein